MVRGRGEAARSDPDRPRAFQRLRELPLIGRAADWGLGPAAVSKHTLRAGTRIAGLKATKSGLGLRALPRRRSRLAAAGDHAAGALFLLSDLALRLAWVAAGRASAHDDEAVARMARERGRVA